MLGTQRLSESNEISTTKFPLQRQPPEGATSVYTTGIAAWCRGSLLEYSLPQELYGPQNTFLCMPLLPQRPRIHKLALKNAFFFSSLNFKRIVLKWCCTIPLTSLRRPLPI